MIKPDHEPSVKRQAELLNISRGSAYYVHRTAPEADQRLMRRIDELHLGTRSRAQECCATCCNGEVTTAAASMLLR